MSAPVHDLVVVGGGPSGLATALHARRAGLDVVVLERRPGTVDKACGEGLMPGGLARLQALGVDPAGPALDGIRYVRDDRCVEAPFRAGRGRGVRRTTLHEALRAQVEREAVPVLEASVDDLAQDDHGVRVGGTTARWAVAADGLHSTVRRRLGLDRPVGGARRHGLRVHVSVRPWTGHVEVHWADDAEAYVTPVADDLVGVAVLTDRRGPLEDRLRAFPHLAHLVERCAVGPVLGAGPLRQRAARRTAGRVLLVGDAAGYVDALTGEGVSLGLAQAEAAVDAIVSGAPHRYERDWRRITRRYALLTGALVTAGRVPAARRGLVPVAARVPRVFGAAVDLLASPA